MAEEKLCPHCLHDHKDRSDTEKKKLMNRLSRIEGQVRGLKTIEELVKLLQKMMK